MIRIKKICKICGKELIKINNSHLKTHDMTFTDYYSMKNRDAIFSYLVGCWIGDGCKTGNHFNICIEKEYTNKMVNLVKKVMQEDVGYRYSHGCLMINKTQSLIEFIRGEINNPQYIYKFPESFIAGFLDTDGWVQLNDKTGKNCDSRVIVLFFSNTNKRYIYLLSRCLNKLKIPYGINEKGKDLVGSQKIICGDLCTVNYPIYELYVPRIINNYLLSQKILPFMIQKKKIQRILSFLDYCDNKSLKIKRYKKDGKR